MKKLKLIIPAVLLLIAIIVTAIFVSPRGSGDYIDKTIKKYSPQGASVAVIKDNEISDIRYYGYSNKDSKEKVTNDTRFKIASVSKTVTAYAILKLVDNGVLNLDTPVNQYLKSWKIPSGEFDGNAVTLRLLLSHTSGISEKDDRYTGELPPVSEALTDMNIHLINTPGASFRYSESTGLGICQLVIEDVTGHEFEDYMVNEVFKPLGMNNTDYKEEGDDLATPYAGFGKAIPITHYVMNGAGGVTTTVHDLALFGIALINYYNEGTTEMFTAQANTESTGGLYALGIIPRKLPDGTMVFEHNGTLTGWNAQLAVSPDGNGIAVVSNSDLAYHMTYELMKKWGVHTFGYPVSDSLFKMMHRVFAVVIILAAAITALFTTMLIMKVRKGRLVRVSHKKWWIKLIISSVLVLLYIFMMYTAIPFKLLYNMENYYFFSFLPRECFWFNVIILTLFSTWIIRGRYKRNVVK